jgi:type I restriction enzyme R subunit
MMSKFTEEGIPNPEKVAGKVREAFEKHPNWKTSEAEMREARKQVTFAIFSEEDDLNKVTATVDALFTLLQRSYKA